MTVKRLGPNALWKTAKFPRDEWDWFGEIDDLGVGNSEICQACDLMEVRYVHVLHHPQWELPIRVGCVCAAHLTGDRETTKAKRKAAAAKAAKTKREKQRQRDLAWNAYLETFCEHGKGVRSDRYGVKVWPYNNQWHVRWSTVQQSYDDAREAFEVPFNTIFLRQSNSNNAGNKRPTV